MNVWIDGKTDVHLKESFFGYFFLCKVVDNKRNININ